MVKTSIKFTLNGVPQTFSGTQDIKEKTFWQQLFNQKPDGWDQPSELFLVVRVKQRNVDGKGAVSALRIELVANSQNENDVLYEKLMDSKDPIKDFIITDVELDQATYQGEIEYLSIPRTAYHNIRTQYGVEPLNETDYTPWTIPTDDQVDAIPDVNIFNNLVRRYNEEVENGVAKQFKFYTDAVNSEGAFWQIEEEKNYNNYYNTAMPAAAKKDIIKEWAVGQANSFDGSNWHSDLATGKDRLKKRLAIFREAAPAKEVEIKKLKEYILNWKKAGNLTDLEHNEVVGNWDKAWNENDTVKKYKDLVAKVGGGDAKYQRQQSKFNEESSREIETGVAANKELTDLGTPVTIAEADISSSTDAAYARKKQAKADFKAMRELKNKILDCKQAVIDLIEGLVASDTGGGGDKLTCPNCKQKFDALPFEYNGKKYHSQQCADEAKQKEQGNGGPDQKNLSQDQKEAIQAINNALNQDHKIATSDLDSDFHNWEAQIKGFNKVEDINVLKDQVLSNIIKKRAEKKSIAEIDNEVTELKAKKSEELKKALVEVWKNDGKKHFESKKSEVRKEGERLFQEDPEKFKDLVKEVVENKMSSCNVSESELDPEEKRVFAKIKNKEISDQNQLQEGKERLIKFIGNKEVSKKIEILKKEVAAASSSNQKTKVKEKLLALLKEDNIYIESRKKDIESLLEKLEKSSSSDHTNSSPGIPWKIVLPIIVIVIVIGLVWWKRRKRLE